MKVFIAASLAVLISALTLFTLPIFNISNITFSQDLTFVNKEKFQKFLNQFNSKNIYNLLYFKTINKQVSLFPEIKTLTLTKTGTSKLHLDIVERKAWISCIVDGKSFFIDKEGYILKRNNQISEFDTENLFIIKGLSENDFNNQKINPTTLSNLISLKDTFDSFLPNHSLLLEKTNLDQWNLLIDDHIHVLFGEINNIDLKFNKLIFFLNSPTVKKHKNIDYIDCRLNNKLLVSYANK